VPRVEVAVRVYVPTGNRVVEVAHHEPLELTVELAMIVPLELVTEIEAHTVPLHER
jgi:hypothetical protein